jgi:hypothetical protein
MNWAMSNDYAALITTLIVAVIAVGTIQLYTLMKRWGDVFAEAGSELVEARRRILDAMAQGQAPTPDDLNAASMSPRWVLAVSRKSFPPYLAAAIWIGVCGGLVVIQASVLRWTAMADKPKSAELAEKSFWVVVAAVVLLIVEGIARALLEARVKVRRLGQGLAHYSRADRQRMHQALTQYRRTGQVPPANTPPSP